MKLTSILKIGALTLSLTPNAFGTTFDAEGLTPLHRAAGEGNVLRVRQLLVTESPLIVDARMGVSVLHKAVYSGNAKVVKLVLDHGAKTIINLQSPSSGNTPLHDSLYFKGKDWSVVNLLLSYGANVRIKNRAGLTPVKSTQLLFKDARLNSALLTAERKFYPLSGSEFMQAIKANDLVTVQRLWSSHPAFKLSDHDENGFTPLIWASREGFTEIVQFLLNEGADPNQLDEWMQANAGHKAGFWGRAIVLTLLIKHGLKVDARGGYNGYTALHDATVRGHTEAIKVLLDAGANCFIKGHDGKTPYSIAVGKQNQEVLQHPGCLRKLAELIVLKSPLSSLVSAGYNSPSALQIVNP